MVDLRPSAAVALAYAVLFLASAAATAESPAPADSKVFQAAADGRVVLLHALESPAGITPGGWRMNATRAETAGSDIDARLGRRAATLAGEALGGGSKGDFAIAGAIPGQPRAVGMWVHLREGANVAEVGFQVHDGEGESLLYKVAADWTGWRWVEAEFADSVFTQAYPQPEKNGRIDGGVRAVHAIWFAKEDGTSAVTIDGLIAATTASDGPQTLTASLEVPAEIDAGQTPAALLMVANPTDAPRQVDVEFVLDADPSLHEPAIPDPVHGSNHAAGATDRAEQDGKVVAENVLTDGDPETAAATQWKAGQTELVQTVTLAEPRRITALAYRSGDANWAWLVDISASVDGQTFTPVQGLQNLSLHKKWGVQRIDVPMPFEAKHLRLRYHDEGRPHEVFRTPAELYVYDGVADEAWDLPRGDRELAAGRVSATIAPRSFDLVELDLSHELQPGAYLLGFRLASKPFTQTGYRHVFVKAPATVEPSPDSRFGINASQIDYAPQHEELGMGWVRFENLKWPFYSPEPGKYDFHGNVGPWHVNADHILQTYHDHGLSVLPFLFMTANYASTAPEGTKDNRRAFYPPDHEKFAEFCFQVAARYGHRAHPPDALLTEDKKSGLGLLEVYEIWNEPNLTDPGWGPWVGTLDQYMAMLRPAVEAIKRADPDAKVTNGGWAGLTVEINEPLVNYTYPDGKRPIDIIDVLNVHHYNGRVPPETARINRNIFRDGEDDPNALTYLEEMQRLVRWRDEHRPGLPIWMTETGHDTGGPIGISERLQAARIPRGLLLALVAGFDKVFIYREEGSTPSLHAAAGLFRNDRSKKPAWYSYATLIREMNGAKNPRRLKHDDPNVWMYAWDRGGKTLVTAWTIEGEAKLGVNLGAAKITDNFGATRTAELGADFVLTDMPIYLTDIARTDTIEAMAQAFAADEARREAQRQRLAQMPAYLYDFGTQEHVGTLLLGEMRRFTPVGLEADDASRGYGFIPGDAMRIDDHHWVRDDLARDGVRVGHNAGFRTRVPPGRYAMRLMVTPIGEQVTIAVAGIAGEAQRLQFTKDDEGRRRELTVDITGPVELTADGYAVFHWLSLLPADAP